MRIFVVSIIFLGLFGAAHAMDENKKNEVVVPVEGTGTNFGETDVVIHIDDLSTNLGVEELTQEDDDSSSLAKKLQKRYKIDERYIPGLKEELESYSNINKIVKKTIGEVVKKKVRMSLHSDFDSEEHVPLEVVQLLLKVMQEKGDDDQKENTTARETIKSKEKSLSTKNKLLGISGGGNIVVSVAFFLTLGLEIYKLIAGNNCNCS